jgi:hypothetical protein
LPFYEEFDEIFGDATATGVFARSSATPLSVQSSNVSSSDDSSSVTNSNRKHTMFINLTDSDDTNKRSKRKVGSNNDAIAESMKSVVAVLQGIAPNHLQCAIESLNKNYMATLSIHQRWMKKYNTS